LELTLHAGCTKTRGSTGTSPVATGTIGDIVGAYKSLVALECLKIFKIRNVHIKPEPIMGKLWQFNYWEHIIRNDRAYCNISEYILNNPAKWNAKKFEQELK